MSQSNVEVPTSPHGATAPAATSPVQPAAATLPTTQTPAAAVPAAQPAATQTPAAAGVADNGGPQPEASWLKGRLEQSERKGEKRLLTELGVANIEDAKRILAAAKAAEDAQKTELQRAKEEVDKLKAQADRASSYEKTVKQIAHGRFAALSEEERGDVERNVGADASPQAQLDEIAKLEPIWARQKAVSAAVQPAAKSAIPAGASTTAATPSPAQTIPPASNQLDTWDRLKASSPLAASSYYEKNQRAICSQIEARRKK